VRELIHTLKYHRQTWPVSALAVIGSRGMRDLRLAPPDALVPVPLHALRQRDRGYNQAALLASAIARRTGHNLLDALKRQRPTTTQTHFDRRQRMRNLRDAFALRQNVNVTNLNLLLVDDVLTTGSTVNECARTLLAAGARHVDALTIARG
jgi:competence protein ComFC